MPTRTAPPTYVRPGTFMARVMNPIAVALGVQAITVRGRHTGLMRTTPLASFEHDGRRYLVAARGETQWARNLRAAGTGRLRLHRRDVEFKAVELFGADRDRILEAYRRARGRRVDDFFTALPQPAEHPVFRIELLDA